MLGIVDHADVLGPLFSTVCLPIYDTTENINNEGGSAYTRISTFSNFVFERSKSFI